MYKLDIQGLQQLCAEARSCFRNNTIISGGAVRDTLLGRPVKDIDIFVQLRGLPDLLSADRESEQGLMEGSFRQRCHNFILTIGLFETDFAVKHFEIFDHADTSDSCGEDVGANVARLSTSNVPVPMEIIALKNDPVDDLVEYDFTISRCFVTARGLFMTQECMYDMRDKIIRYEKHNNHNEACWQRSKRRLARLRAKYPDWTCVGTNFLDNLESTS